MKTLISIFLLFITFGINAQSFNRISKQVCRCNSVSSSKNYFHKIRIKLKKTEEAKAILSSNKYYIVEYFDIQDGGYYGEIWDEKSDISYTYINKTLSFTKEKSIPQKIKDSIMNWDKEEIIRESMQVKISPQNTIYVSKVNVSTKNIECFSFNQFF